MRRADLVLAFAVAALAGVQEASATPFTRSEILSPDCPGDLVSSGPVLGPTSVSCGAQIAEADFGVNRVAAFDEEGTSVNSFWVDEFTLSGSQGTGSITFIWSFDGAITGDAFISVFELFGQTSTLFSAGGTSQVVNQTLSLTMPFTYDVMFSGGLWLSGSILDDRPPVPALNFMNTLDLTSVVIPDGSTLRTGSGTLYPLQTATPVPEPATLLLITTGGLGLIARRRNRRR